MSGGKEKAGQKGEMIDEEAKFGLALAPMRRPVEGEAEK